jgi:hypothetical protein
MHFCQHCSRNPFQHLLTNYTQHPGLHHHSCSASLSHDLSKSQIRGKVQTVWCMCGHFPAILCNCRWCQMCSVRSCLVLKDDKSLALGAFHKVHVTVSCVSEHRKLCWWFPISEENQLICIPEDSSRIFAGWGYNFGFLFLSVMWYNSMLCHLISGSKQWNHLSSWVMMYRKSSPLAAFHWSKCDDTSTCLVVFICKQAGNTMETNFPISQSCYHLLHSMVSYTKLQCNFPNHNPLVLFDECLIFLFSAICCGASQSTAV